MFSSKNNTLVRMEETVFQLKSDKCTQIKHFCSHTQQQKKKMYPEKRFYSTVHNCIFLCRRQKRPWRRRITTWRRCRTRRTPSRWPRWIRRWPRRGRSLCSWRSTRSRRKWTSSPWTWRSSSTRSRRKVLTEKKR